MFMTTSIAGWRVWMSAANGGHLVVVGDVECAVLGHLRAQRTRVGDGHRPSPSASRSVRYSSAPCGGQLQRGRAADAAGGPVEKQRLPAKPPCAMAVTLLTLLATRVGATPQRRPATAARRCVDGTLRDRSPRPTKALSCVSVIVVVAASVRTRAGRSSEIGLRVGVLLEERDELVDRRCRRSRPSSRGSARRCCEPLRDAVSTGSSFGDTPRPRCRPFASRTPTGVSPGSRGAKWCVSLSSSVAWRRPGSPRAPRTSSRSRSRSRTGRRRPAR